jgi:hypothetical protein
MGKWFNKSVGIFSLESVDGTDFSICKPTPSGLSGSHLNLTDQVSSKSGFMHLHMGYCVD